MGQKVAFLDTETTGLIKTLIPRGRSPDPRIIEIYLSLWGDGQKVEEVDELINPGVPLEPVITRVTGLADKDLAGKPTFAQIADRVGQILGAADVLVAHNLSFDLTVLEGEFRALGQTVPWPDTHYCTVEQTEGLYGYRLNLSALHSHLFGVAFAEAHRARFDVEALERCYWALNDIEVASYEDQDRTQL